MVATPRTQYGFVLSKGGAMIYISHLDLLRLLGRALRRAELPVTLTEGFSPRLKFRLYRALKVGVASEGEEGALFLEERLEAAQVRQRLQEQLPPGIELKDVWIAS